MQVKLNVIVAAVASVLAGTVMAQDMVVKIGHVGPVSGAQAHYGKDNENGARMAIDDLNAKGVTIGGKKVKLELVAEDDAADPKQGTAAAQKLCDAKVAGVAGHLNSGTTIPASAVYNQCGIPHVTPSATNPKLTQQGFKTSFRMLGGNALGAGLLHATNNKLKKVASSMTAPPTARAWPRSSRRPPSRRASRSSTSSTPPTRPPTSWPS
jgi:branched-chain amino acid transport system substrate-binding protein